MSMAFVARMNEMQTQINEQAKVIEDLQNSIREIQDLISEPVEIGVTRNGKKPN